MKVFSYKRSERPKTFVFSEMKQLRCFPAFWRGKLTFFAVESADDTGTITALEGLLGHVDREEYFPRFKLHVSEQMGAVFSWISREVISEKKPCRRQMQVRGSFPMKRFLSHKYQLLQWRMSTFSCIITASNVILMTRGSSIYANPMTQSEGL